MKKKYVWIIIISVILLISIATIVVINDKTIMFSSNMKGNVEKFWKDKVVIKEVKNIEIDGKKFRLILSTPINNKKYKYFNCYEEKLNGLYYKSYQASAQGGSNALFNFTTMSIREGKGVEREKDITIVYGYNEDLLLDNYALKISGDNNNIITSLSNKEYVINVFKGPLKEIVNAKGKDGSDLIKAFCD